MYNNNNIWYVVYARYVMCTGAAAAVEVNSL